MSKGFIFSSNAIFFVYYRDDQYNIDEFNKHPNFLTCRHLDRGFTCFKMISHPPNIVAKGTEDFTFLGILPVSRKAIFSLAFIL